MIRSDRGRVDEEPTPATGCLERYSPGARGGAGPGLAAQGGGAAGHGLRAGAARRASLVVAALAALAAGFFLLAMREEDRLLDALIRRSLTGVDRRDTCAVVLALSHEIYERTGAGIRAEDLPFYERLESLSPFHMTSAVALRHGAFGVIGHSPYGPCGTMSRVLLNACWRLGIRARKLHLIPPAGSPIDIHTLVEWRSGGRWPVVSPSDDFAWRTRDGRIATVEEIRGDSLVFAQVLQRVPGFAVGFENTRRVRWEKLPRPLPWAIRTVLGERRYRGLETPRLYDQPRRLMFAGSLVVLVGALLGARRSGTPRRDRPAAAAAATGPGRS